MDSRAANRLNALLKAFQAGNLHDLKRIGNDSIEEAVLGNSAEFSEIAVIAYSLYKILSKDHFTKNRHWTTVSLSIKKALENALSALQNNEEGAFKKYIANVQREIEVVDSRLSNFAKNIYEKARIKQASTAYALGMSMNQAAKLTGADPKSLQNYIGTTKIHDEEPVKMGIRKRMSVLKGALDE